MATATIMGMTTGLMGTIMAPTGTTTMIMGMGMITARRTITAMTIMITAPMVTMITGMVTMTTDTTTMATTIMGTATATIITMVRSPKNCA